MAVKMEECGDDYVYSLIESGWVGYYHFILECPHNGDLSYEHFHLRDEELGRRFPFLKCKLEVQD